MLPCLDPGTGLLPPGRHVCTAAEVEIGLVKSNGFSASATRPEIWDHWNAALGVLQSSVLVHAAWLGGSFTTSKLDPDDIDVTFIINGDDLIQRGAPDQRIVSLFEGNNQLKSQLNLRVDSYAFAWQPDTPGVRNRSRNASLWARGYWDDWWQRVRQSPKGSASVPGDSVPRRGYLEVLVSDYPG